MISVNTRKKLFDFFLQLANSEKQAETLRLLVCQDEQFIPYSAFQKLICKNSNSITKERVYQFLMEHGITHSLNEINQFIKYYDLDDDERLSFQEFLRVVLPLNDADLRLKCAQRIPRQNQQAFIQKENSDYPLCKLLDIEIKNNTIIEDLKQKLQKCHDFNIDGAFTLIDKYKKGNIDEKDINYFFQINEYASYNEEIVSLMRRLDVDNDGIITEKDFQKVVGLQKNSQSDVWSQKTIKKRQISPSKYELEKINVLNELNESIISRNYSNKSINNQQFCNQFQQNPKSENWGKIITRNPDNRNIIKDGKQINIIKKYNSTYEVDLCNYNSKDCNNENTSKEKTKINKQKIQSNDRVMHSQSLHASPLQENINIVEWLNKDAQYLSHKFKPNHKQINNLEDNVDLMQLIDTNQKKLEKQTSYQRQKQDIRFQLDQASFLKKCTPTKNKSKLNYHYQQSKNSSPILIKEEIDELENQKMQLSLSREERSEQYSILKQSLLQEASEVKQKMQEQNSKKINSKLKQNPKKVLQFMNINQSNRITEKNVEENNYYTIKQQNFSKEINQQENQLINKKENSQKIVTSYLLDLFQQIINYEKQIERIKQDLSLRSDFTIKDLFRLIDKLGRGAITSINFQDFLRELGVIVSINQILLFMRRFSKDRIDRLIYIELEKALQPQQVEYESLISHRKASSRVQETQLKKIFSEETIQLLRTLLNIMIENETEIEQQRWNLEKNLTLSLEQIFNLLDINEDNFISSTEMQIFFEKNEIVMTDNELKYFINRFAREKHNKISLQEFTYELTTKSNGNI